MFTASKQFVLQVVSWPEGRSVTLRVQGLFIFFGGGGREGEGGICFFFYFDFFLNCFWFLFSSFHLKIFSFFILFHKKYVSLPFFQFFFFF